MSKLLYIKANAKPAGASRTFKISDAFITQYKQNNPQDLVITLDLYKENINFLSAKQIELKFNPADGGDPFLSHVRQFVDADKYVFAEPLWNLGIPSILKAYIDYICIVGITFKYTEQGPVGLLKDKKAVNITSRGGAYDTPPFSELEMGNRYLRTILGFLGVQDYHVIAANMLDVIGVDVEAVVGKAIQEATELAKSF